MLSLRIKKASNLSPDLTMRYLLEYLVGSGVKSTTTARYPILGLARKKIKNMNKASSGWARPLWAEDCKLDRPGDLGYNRI